MNKGVFAMVMSISLFAANLIALHYYQISDFFYGIGIGISLGLMLVALKRIALLKD